MFEERIHLPNNLDSTRDADHYTEHALSTNIFLAHNRGPFYTSETKSNQVSQFFILKFPLTIWYSFISFFLSFSHTCIYTFVISLTNKVFGLGSISFSLVNSKITYKSVKQLSHIAFISLAKSHLWFTVKKLKKGWKGLPSLIRNRILLLPHECHYHRQHLLPSKRGIMQKLH